MLKGLKEINNVIPLNYVIELGLKIINQWIFKSSDMAKFNFIIDQNRVEIEKIIEPCS